MEVKILTSDDAERYWELRLEALQQNPEAFATSYEEAIKRENAVQQTSDRLKAEGNYTFGAFHNDELIGMVTLLTKQSSKMGHKAAILAMYVTPEKRRLGAGQALLIRAIEQAKHLETTEQLDLAVVTNNHSAKNLYSSLGFEVYGTERRAMKFNGNYYDEDLMVLFL